ncbi:MAG: hypothetical protein PHC55_05210 [Bacteroidales bacterium]|jgi:hypothetical protein|nr:hypothetical protein [Bacteroidales bacterium]
MDTQILTNIFCSFATTKEYFKPSSEELTKLIAVYVPYTKMIIDES